MLDLFQLLSSPDVNWWTGVVWITCGLLWCFYQLFGLSFWRHPFTAEHPLLRHWCRDTFLQTWWRNKLILILDGLRVRIVMQIMLQCAKNKIYCLKTRACFLSFNFEANDLDVSLTALARLCRFGRCFYPNHLSLHFMSH